MERTQGPRRRARRALAPLVWVLAQALCAARGQAEPRCLDGARVCLEEREEGRTLSFVVSNREAAPYTARIMLSERHNVEPLTPLPFRAVIEPGGQAVVGVLAVKNPRESTHYELHWGAAPGDARARHDASARYRMPFGGPQSHALMRGPAAVAARDAARQDYDFAMPWGTPVLAARAGRVIGVVDGHAANGQRGNLGGPGNRVDVLHADGTIASYAHLRRGAVVEMGQEVAVGQRIGFSGDAGCAGEPHLQFGVWKREADLGEAGVTPRFHDGSAQGFVPRIGVAYAPACAQSGAGCAPGERPPSSEAAAPAAPGESAVRVPRRDDGACMCGNGAVIHVDLPCDLVCPR